jgi:holliday junction DNA helicase RuvA
MISRLKGVVLARDLERVEVETPGGVVYEVEIPLTLLDRLPREGQPVELRTVYIVREDSAALYGFLEPHERALFLRLLGADRVGAKLALAMMSTFSARRLARALTEKDLTALTQIPGVGRKTAERLALELADKVQDLAIGPEGKGGAAAPGAEEAVAALMGLGISFTDADRAVRAVLDEAETPPPLDALIRKALARR